MRKNCKWCGFAFAATGSGKEYCTAECRQMALDFRRKQKKASGLSSQIEIEDIAAKAQAAGLSYGKYIAMQRAEEARVKK